MSIEGPIRQYYDKNCLQDKDHLEVFPEYNYFFVLFYFEAGRPIAFNIKTENECQAIFQLRLRPERKVK